MKLNLIVTKDHVENVDGFPIFSLFEKEGLAKGKTLEEHYLEISLEDSQLSLFVEIPHEKSVQIWAERLEEGRPVIINQLDYTFLPGTGWVVEENPSHDELFGKADVRKEKLLETLELLS